MRKTSVTTTDTQFTQGFSATYSTKQTVSTSEDSSNPGPTIHQTFTTHNNNVGNTNVTNNGGHCTTNLESIPVSNPLEKEKDTDLRIKANNFP